MTKRIILAVSGSISAYKSADLTSKLKKKGYDIHVIMTEAAQAFITPRTTPKLIAPAMNTKMYENPLTKKNLETLQEVGYQKILPKSGLLACGDTGRGALADIAVIIDSIDSALTRKGVYDE